VYECQNEKCQEYQEVAGIVCQDLELLQKMAKGNRTAEELKSFIALMYNNMKEAIADKEKRKSRYQAMGLLFNMVAKRE